MTHGVAMHRCPKLIDRLAAHVSGRWKIKPPRRGKFGKRWACAIRLTHTSCLVPRKLADNCLSACAPITYQCRLVADSTAYDRLEAGSPDLLTRGCASNVCLVAIVRPYAPDPLQCPKSLLRPEQPKKAINART